MGIVHGVISAKAALSSATPFSALNARAPPPRSYRILAPFRQKGSRCPRRCSGLMAPRTVGGPYPFHPPHDGTRAAWGPRMRYRQQKFYNSISYLDDRPVTDNLPDRILIS